MKSKNKTISVIVPVYNCERYLQKCIDSILSQTIQDFEVILINDGSTDNSLEICKEYTNRYPEKFIVIDKKNEGVSIARNTGIHRASGKYITFIDSDDWIEPTYLEDFKYDSISADLYSQGIRYFIAHKNQFKPMFKYEQTILDFSLNPNLLIEYGILNNGCPVAKLFKRDIIINNNLKFNSKLSINEDHLFVTNYIKYIDSIYLSAATNYNYLFQISQTSLTKKHRSHNEYLIVGKAMNEGLKELMVKYRSNVNWAKVAHLYGPDQVLKALASAVLDKKLKTSFAECLKDWNEYVPSPEAVIYSSGNNKTLSWILNSKIRNPYKQTLISSVLSTAQFFNILKSRLRSIVYKIR